jgi:hypothetical protein
MKLQLIGYTPHLEEVLATAVLTTTTGSTPSKVFSRVSGEPKRIKSLIGGLQLQHGSVLEHNRINWLLEASDEEALNLLLKSKFFNLTRLKAGFWLLSANLRTIVEYVRAEEGPMRDALFDSMKEFAPTMLSCLEAKIREG